MFNTLNTQQTPFRTAGAGAVGNLADLLGTSGNTGATGYGSLARPMTNADLTAQLAPNYAFQLQQGQNALNAQQNATGGLVGGNALQALQNYTQNYAQNAYQNAFNNYQAQQTNIYNRLSNLAGLGQTAAANTGNVGASIGNAAATNVANAGTAEIGRAHV